MQTKFIEVANISNGRYYSNKIKQMVKSRVVSGKSPYSITVATSDVYRLLHSDLSQVSSIDYPYIVLEGDPILGAYRELGIEEIECFIIDNVDDLEEYLSYI